MRHLLRRWRTLYIFMSKTSFYQESIRFGYHAVIIGQYILRKLAFAVFSKYKIMHERQSCNDIILYYIILYYIILYYIILYYPLSNLILMYGSVKNRIIEGHFGTETFTASKGVAYLDVGTRME